MTCKRFLEVSKYHVFMDRKVLNLHKIDFYDDKPPISMFRNSFRFFPSVTLYLVRFNDNNLFWKIFGYYIKNLEIKICSIKKTKLLQILYHCPNLEQLTIQNFDELLSSWNRRTLNLEPEKFNPLCRLRELKIRNVNNLTAELFDYLTDMMPILEVLEVTNCFINTTATARVKIIDHIVYFCELRAPRIRTINLSGTPADDIALKKLAAVEDLHLTGFSLTFLGKMSDDGIQAMIRSQPTLTHLDLSGSIGLVDEGLILITMKMPNIKVLNIRQCVMLTCRGFAALKDMKHLEILNVSECERIKDEGFIEGLTGKYRTVGTVSRLSACYTYQHLNYKRRNFFQEEIGMIGSRI